ncbi:complement C4-B [Tachysurus fulvidraco]|uniref:complement C4-B n=1 Tax=Tachysurus fulvidraco TaxID=1234273 RepID=UPI001FEFFF1D|nr:complement C4-B [Tachysurus fulvidraco]
MGFLLYLLLCSGYFAHLVSAETFLVTAPSVFHVGTKEKVSVQVGESLLNKPVTCYLEQEVGRVLMSKKETIWITEKGKIGTLELEISPNRDERPQSATGDPSYLNLVCDVDESKRKITRVLVSQHRGYIFIQTNQPMYNPTQKVRYRIFTLNYAMRPVSEIIHVYLINSEGNTLKKFMTRSKEGITANDFRIPDVSQPGVWKIKAHYKGDEKSATIREFKVQKFVLPSFGVTIKPKTDHLLVSAENFQFSIDVSYSYGKKISGGFHCRFGLRADNTNDIKFLKGIEKIGPVRDGEAEITLKISDIQEKLEPLKLVDVAQNGARFYIAVTVTDTLSGEVQESEIFLPIVAQRYKLDLERTRSHFIPKMPFSVKVVVRSPNGVPATAVPVKISVSHTNEKSIIVNTDDNGVANYAFNVAQSPQSISVEATVDGIKSEKNVAIATSTSNNFLLISVGSKVLGPGEQLNLKFDIVNGQAKDGYVYYLIFSKGALRQSGSVITGGTATISITLSHDLIPSFRLIGYYYDRNSEIIADSIWVDIKDVCEGKVVITEKDSSKSIYRSPSQTIDLNIDVAQQQNAMVALLAVDKAIYSLNAENKLTPKQVFSSMQSYDLGCSYGGGGNTAAVFNDAGLSFISHSQTIKSQMRIGFGCESGFRRQRRAIDLQKELAKKETEFQDAALQKCCRQGLTLLPMKLSCEERKKRMNSANECVEAFMKCCNFATTLRKKKRKEEITSDYGRTASASEIENFFENDIQYIRHSFPPSFAFDTFKVNGQITKRIILPDSITTWEIQAVSLSLSHGLCVAKPYDILAYKELFVSLQLPYSVRKSEQMAIVVVIHNYGQNERELAVHMKQVEGLCSPGALSTESYVNVSLSSRSSETVTFSAVPLMDGEIPITIQLYDREFNEGVDAIQKTLLVMNDGVRDEQERSTLINLDGRKDIIIDIDGSLPNGTVPGTESNIFVKIEDEVFGVAAATPLLTPANVNKLIKAPYGCAEQTMIRMSPTALAIRYLDSNNRWLELEPEMRDKALKNIDDAYNRILTYKKPDGSYGAWLNYPTSNWLTALVVKVLSLVADCELSVTEDKLIVSQLEIRNSVNYLIEQQGKDGSFTDPNPVIHREMQGGIGGVEQDASLTAFTAIALNRALPFMDQETDSVRNSVSQATRYLLSRVDELQRPFSLAITTYCLSLCLEDKTMALSAWGRLKTMAIKEGDCKVWRDNEDMRLQDEKNKQKVPPTMALTVETTAYALLAAIKLKDFENAKMAVCFLSSQENYEGGFKSTQDTIIALEALSEYALHLPQETLDFKVQFTSLKKNEKEGLSFNKKGEKKETDLKRLLGSDIFATFSGKGQAKVKVVKAYYVPDTSSLCSDLTITVTVQGKAEYTSQVMETYDYDYSNDYEVERKEEEDYPRSAIEWFDARTRRRRDIQSTQNSENIMYKVCISHSRERNLTGMAIADITLLSGFEPETEELDLLKNAEVSYISHYEITNGRVLLYFNEIHNSEECIAFGAVQRVPIGLLQPAPASFYDYYEPERKCTTFYAAPKRSKVVSALCVNDVCQCAERPCFKAKETNTATLTRIQKDDRFRHACYQPVADYGFMVTVNSVEDKKSFDFYHTTVTEVLKFNGDVNVEVGDSRYFAKRKHCKSQLIVGETYLIMGRDGLTTDNNGQMVYLLDANTWVEQKQTNKCKASTWRQYCKKFKDFLVEYQDKGCSQ